MTGDIDFFYDASDANATALFQALTVFWGGRIPGIERVEELREEGIIIQFRVPPNRIDRVVDQIEHLFSIGQTHDLPLYARLIPPLHSPKVPA
ncbi:MAG: hypothetical protein AB9869_12545 [Verrucomicrobiia bacterium]